MKLIDKEVLVAEIERRIEEITLTISLGDKKIQKSGGNRRAELVKFLSFLDTLEVKEVGISIPNIDDILKEVGLDPDSKEAKIFKESYYIALEKLKAQKGEEV